jgi:hypothetical protein
MVVAGRSDTRSRPRNRVGRESLPNPSLRVSDQVYGGLSPRLTADQQASAQQAIAAACEPHSYFYGLFGAANLPTMLLVLIGVCGIGAALRTLKAIEKQAEAAVNAERAWLVAELVPTATKHGSRFLIPADGYTGELSGEDMAGSKHFQYQLKVTNMGKTPAVITKYTIKRSNGTDEGTLIDFELPYRSIGAGGQWYFYALDVDGESTNYRADDHVFFFGNVSYQHVFSRRDTVLEPFAYSLKRDTGRLERIPVGGMAPKNQKPN